MKWATMNWVTTPDHENGIRFSTSHHGALLLRLPLRVAKDATTAAAKPKVQAQSERVHIIGTYVNLPLFYFANLLRFPVL